jgi:hypothetical protein
MEERGKIIRRFAAGTALIAGMYFGAKQIHTNVRALFYPKPVPEIVLASGKDISAGAGETVQFTKSTAKEKALSIWPADAAPAINEFMSRFRCSGCSKNCLLIAPLCINGKIKSTAAVQVYQEIYPGMEI